MARFPRTATPHNPGGHAHQVHHFLQNVLNHNSAKGLNEDCPHHLTPWSHLHSLHKISATKWTPIFIPYRMLYTLFSQ